MLTVYTYRIPKPMHVFDVSDTPLDELADRCLDIFHHQRDVTLWFGYLDGWMLNPREEVLLRKVIRAFPCVCVSLFPLAFSQAWKNEIDTIYTDSSHGDANSNHNGGSLQHGSSFEYGQACARSSSGGAIH